MGRKMSLFMETRSCVQLRGSEPAEEERGDAAGQSSPHPHLKGPLLTRVGPTGAQGRKPGVSFRKLGA